MEDHYFRQNSPLFQPKIN